MEKNSTSCKLNIASQGGMHLPNLQLFCPRDCFVVVFHKSLTVAPYFNIWNVKTETCFENILTAGNNIGSY